VLGKFGLYLYYAHIRINDTHPTEEFLIESFSSLFGALSLPGYCEAVVLDHHM
jgi:hypothetical protein